MILRKAVLLAAGEGKRLLPITSTRPKHMISIGGKPLIQHTVDYLKQVGIEEILIIVGYMKDQIIEYFQDGKDFGIKIEYIEQIEYLGTADAARLSMNFVKKEPFILLYGDLLVDQEVFVQLMNGFKNSKVDGIICGFEAPDPQKYGVVKVSKTMKVEKIIEKPKDSRFGNLINGGIYIFTHTIFEGIEKTVKSSRGEYELTDSIQYLVDNGFHIQYENITGKFWSDIGHPWQILDGNKYLLSKIKGNNRGLIENGVVIKGEVIIGNKTVIKSGSYLEGPIFIGENSKIGPSAYLRPFTFLGNDVKIGNSSEVKNSIIMNDTKIPHFSYVGDSVIGENVNLGAGTILSNVRLDKSEISMFIKGKKVRTGKKKLGAVIGDNVQLGVNSLIMCGIKIGRNAKIGAGTIITKDVPDWTTVYVSQKEILKSNKK